MNRLPKNHLHTWILSLAALLFVASGALRARYLHNDFVPVYEGAKCLLRGCNPYASGELLYPPSTLLVMSPLALLFYKAAWSVWFLLNAALFIGAVFLVLSISPDEYPWLKTFLGAVVLAGSSLLLILGQPSAFAVALLCMSVCFLLRGEHLFLACTFLMVSLAVKPQMGGLIALYLLFRGVQRRFVALSMAGALTALVCGSVLLSLHAQGTRWVSDLRANVSQAVAPGATDDPRPTNDQATAALNLQTVTSLFFHDEKAFNAAAFAVFGLLFAAWAIAVLRTSPDTHNHLLAVGALTVLTLMPVYHRNYDSRFLVLCIPGALIILTRRRISGVAACLLLALATVSLQHWLQIYFLQHGLLNAVQHHKVLFILLLRESNLRLVALFGLFFVALLDLPPNSSRNERVAHTTPLGALCGVHLAESVGTK